MTNSVSTYANTHDQLQVEIWPEEKWNIITSKWDKTLWRLSVFDCPEIPENLVGALLHLKHNGAVTHGAVIFFHLFLNTAPAPVWVHALQLLLNRKYI